MYYRVGLPGLIVIGIVAILAAAAVVLFTLVVIGVALLGASIYSTAFYVKRHRRLHPKVKVLPHEPRHYVARYR